MRILIINITRFGDTLQMQPLLRALKNDGHEVGIVCLENFVDVICLLDGVSHAFPIPASNMLRFLKEDNAKNWLNSLVTLEDFIKNIKKEFDPERIINLTPLPSARLLSRRLGQEGRKDNRKIFPPVYGFTFDDQGYGNNTNAWATYMEAVTLNRISSPLNLADLFTLIAGESLHTTGAQNPQIAPLDEIALKKARNLCNTMVIENAQLINNESLAKANTSYLNTPKSNVQDDNSLKYVALQLGASMEKRQWDIAHFAKLSHMLAEKGFTPIIVGAPNETALATEFLQHGGIAKNAIGKTNIEELAALLKQCMLLVTNDTGTMHLAAAVNTPILGIFMATAQPWDTGAISTDACFVETRMPCHPCDFSTRCPYNNACRTSVVPDIIADIVIKRLTTGQWGQHFSETTRIWKSIRDKDGFLMLEAMDVLDKNARLALYTMQREVYKNLVERLQLALSGNKNANDLDSRHVNLDAKINREYLKDFSLPEFSMDYVQIVKPSERAKIKEKLSSLLELFFLLKQQGKLLGSVPKMSQMFLATNQNIIDTFKSLPYLVPMAHMWKFGMEKYGMNLDDFFNFSSIIQEVLETWLKAISED